MFCGKCGKEMNDQAKFCPHCGAENLRAKTAPQTSRSAPAAPGQVLDLSPLRLALAVLGTIQALMFFVLSYGKLSGLSSTLGQLSSYLGTEIPQKLTGLNAIKVMKLSADLNSKLGMLSGSDSKTAYLTAVIFFGLPLVAGIAVLAINLLKGGRKGAVSTVILTVVTLADYFIINALLDAYTEMGYKMGGGFMFACLVTVVQLVSAVISLKQNKDSAK